MTLPTRQLGTLTVSAIGLGCMNLSHAYGTPPPADEGARLLNRALDLGVTLLDTAALYGGGRNEALIADAVGHRRGDYVLASKCVLGLREGKRILDGSPEAIAWSIDQSLQRLRTDHIDLMYLHRADPAVPIEDSVAALVRAKEAGKIGALGLSEMASDTIRRAHAVHPVTAVQTEYSPAVRNPEIAVLETCRALDIGFVAFSPVGRGLLAGGVRDDAYASGDLRLSMPRFTGENLRHNLSIAARFADLASSLGITPAQLSLAWLLARGAIPIPGTTSVAHLEEDVGAAEVTLPAEAIAAVEAILPPGKLRGARYPRAAQAQVTTETFPDEELA
ncbi:Predicted oxidoreductase [Sphingomonas guangdongensis]|uniref:Predicted oxidoreductase n=1 Tax=Sphingomonas guangdongensis TaxID=1141890 RepID=A0A285R287_9SPHN|nr:aldo/keto reductase [Sphingomonas guangdongensis]SOB88220.1 Predicted oxidoreductase [Sphingomonas guangdongensis]